MQIFVKLPGGKVMSMDVTSDMKVIDLKMQIQKQTQIHISEQMLILNGKELDNTKTLEESDVKKETSIYLVVDKKESSFVASSGNFQVTVMISEDKRILLDVNSKMTIKEIKKKTEERTSMNAGNMNIFYRGQKLDDGCTIGSIGLKAGDTLAAIGFLKGGL